MVREIKVWNVHQRDMKLIKFHLNFHKGTTPEASFWIQKTKFNSQGKSYHIKLLRIALFWGANDRRIYPVFLEFIEKKNGKLGWRLDMANWDLFHLEDEFSDYPLVACSLRIYPVLLEFIFKKMENRGKDYIWQVSRINSTWRTPFFL